MAEALIQQLVNTYEHIKAEYPSSWFVVSDDGKKEEHAWTHVCHAQMQYHKPGLYDQCFTAVARDQPLDLAYITFLIEGPFRSFKDRISLESIEVEGVQKYYLHCTKLDTWPANVLYNFCIATRTPVEYPEIVENWGKLRAAGVHETLALLVAAPIGRYHTKVPAPGSDPWGWSLKDTYCPQGHYFYDPTSSWKALITGEPQIKKFKASYKKNPKEVRPCNEIWGQSDRQENSAIVGKTVKELTEYFGLVASDPEVEFQKMVDAFEIIEADPDYDEDDFDDDDHDFDDDLFVDLDDDI